MAGFTVRCLENMADIDASRWRELYGRATEGFDFFSACELAPAPSFAYSAIAVDDGERLAAGAPVFQFAFDPGVVLDGGLRSAFSALANVIPAIANIPAIGFGSPHTQASTLQFAPNLSPADRERALAALLEGIDDRARSTGARLILLKDVGEDIASWAHAMLEGAGYARATSLPLAILPVPTTEETYIQSLSANMRSNLRRRLKRAEHVRIEQRRNCNDLADQLNALRQNTLERADVDFAQFAETSPDFFNSVFAGVGDNARLLTYWLDDRLIGFAMVLIGADTLVQTYNGMRYPEGPDNGLFYLDWMTQVRLCQELGIRQLQSGVTTYLIKARLGCTFHRSYLYVRHRYPVVNSLVGALARGVNLEEGDAGLIELGPSAPFADPEKPGQQSHRSTVNALP